MNKEEQILSATLRDRFRQCENRGFPSHSGFLTAAEVVFAEAECIRMKARFLLSGGYEDAERRICIFLPEGSGLPPEEEAERAEGMFLAALRISVPAQSRGLTHRDYLGAMLGLGVERSVIGDILVRSGGADVIVLKDMAGFFMSELRFVGRAPAEVSELALSDLAPAEQSVEVFRDTVASLRLDSVAAGAFRTARGKAQEAVRQGLVSVNGRQVLKPDRELSEGDRISVRGKGKAVLSEIGSRTRKDRIAITITRFR